MQGGSRQLDQRTGRRDLRAGFATSAARKKPEIDIARVPGHRSFEVPYAPPTDTIAQLTAAAPAPTRRNSKSPSDISSMLLNCTMAPFSSRS